MVDLDGFSEYSRFGMFFFFKFILLTVADSDCGQGILPESLKATLLLPKAKSSDRSVVFCSIL